MIIYILVLHNCIASRKRIEEKKNECILHIPRFPYCVFAWLIMVVSGLL